MKDLVLGSKILKVTQSESVFSNDEKNKQQNACPVTTAFLMLRAGFDNCMFVQFKPSSSNVNPVI
jgi:hypothetical protein